MGHRLMGSILAVVAVLAFSPVIFAQTAQRPGAARAQATPPTVDLSGVWRGVGDPDGPRRSWTREPPPLQPDMFYRYQYNNMKPPGGTGRIDDKVFSPQLRNEIMPVINCIPEAMPWIMADGGEFEIIQSPRRVLMLFTLGHWVRQIWTDGREHPKNADPTWNGHSIGRWDRDTLVVDTIGITEHTYMDEAGTPHSEVLHVVERYRRVNHDTLEIEFLFEDRKAFTKPWGGKVVRRLDPAGEVTDNNWDGNKVSMGGYVTCSYDFDDWMRGRSFHLPK